MVKKIICSPSHADIRSRANTTRFHIVKDSCSCEAENTYLSHHSSTALNSKSSRNNINPKNRRMYELNCGIINMPLVVKMNKLQPLATVWEDLGNTTLSENRKSRKITNSV
jgi:hypothetical protein